MYGMDTDQPFEFLMNCIEILQKYAIPLPVYPRPLTKRKVLLIRSYTVSGYIYLL